MSHRTSCENDDAFDLFCYEGGVEEVPAVVGV